MDKLEKLKDSILNNSASWPGVRKHQQKLLKQYSDLLCEAQIEACCRSINDPGKRNMSVEEAVESTEKVSIVT